MVDKYNLIDLFCGAGGLSLGFSNIFGHNFKSVWANDINQYAAETYNANLDNNCVVGDIAGLLYNTKTEIPAADVVIGGPPCQGFSLLNKKRNGDVRRNLWRPFMEVVERSGADVFVMENVPQLLDSEEYEQIAEHAAQLGFFPLARAKLCAADYGVPQMRFRAFIIGCKFTDPKEFFPPLKTHYNPALAPIDKPKPQDGYIHNPLPWRTVQDAIGDLPEPAGKEIRMDTPPPLDLHFGRTPTEISLRRYMSIPDEGMNRFDLQRIAPEITPECWINKTSGGTDLFGRLWWNRPSVTIRTEFFKPEKGRYLHPSKHRPITHREAARIQSFPDSFRFLGNKIEIAKQIGNAVPPLLAAQIAESVETLLKIRNRIKLKGVDDLARRSKPADIPEEIRQSLVNLLTDFSEELKQDGLRNKVVALVPAFHMLRDLGSSLVPKSDATSAGERIIAYLRQHPHSIIDGDELMVVSGISEYARRIRELRVQSGWWIYSGVTFNLMAQNPDEASALKTIGIDPSKIKPDQYVLMNTEQDRDSAYRWHIINSIRKEDISVRSKIIKFMRMNVGAQVTGEELSYLAGSTKDWARRIRELRTEDGWPIVTKNTGRDDLPVGVYVLEEDRQAYEHDRIITDKVRVAVLERDNYECVECHWNRAMLSKEDPRKMLELHHKKHHKDGGDNTGENLVTLCNVCHDDVHRKND